MPRFNGDIRLDGNLVFPSGAENTTAIRAFSNESGTGEPASGQIRFLQVGNEEGYWYLLDHPTADLFDFDASIIPSGHRLAVLADLEGLGGGGNPVDSRAVTGVIIPDTHALYDIGSSGIRFANIYGVSGVFGKGSNDAGILINIDDPEYFADGALSGALQIKVDRNRSADYNTILVTTSGTSTFRVRGDGLVLTEAIFFTPEDGKIPFNASLNSSHNAPHILTTAANTSYGSIMEWLRAERTGSTGFHFMLTSSDLDPDTGIGNTRHALRGDGGLFSDVAAATPADYAEYFECADPRGILPGYPVAINSSGLIEIANENSDVIGVVSAAPAYIADAAWSSWHAKFLKDDFGRRIKDLKGDEVLNPAWDARAEYVSREDRPEWVTVGLIGKLWVRTVGALPTPGQYVAIGRNGMFQIATTEKNKWLVLEPGISFDNRKGYGTARILFR